jgi:hypothetical protein
MKATATVPKKRLSFSLSSTSGPTGAGSPRRLSVVNSPSKAQNSGKHPLLFYFMFIANSYVQLHQDPQTSIHRGIFLLLILLPGLKIAVSIHFCFRPFLKLICSTSGLTNTNTPKGLAAVDSPSKAQGSAMNQLHPGSNLIVFST